MTDIYFIRHGESQANLERVFAGWYNCPLTDRGREQARRTAAFLQEIPFAAVYASDLHRAYETGLAVAQLKELTAVPMTALREINAGQWEKQPFDTLEERFPEDYHVWLTAIGLAKCTGGETVAHLQQRVRQTVEAIARCHPGQAVCVATHATPIRVMEAVWTDTPLDQLHTIPWVHNASVTHVQYDEKGTGHLVERDMYAHLTGVSTALPANV